MGRFRSGAFAWVVLGLAWATGAAAWEFPLTVENPAQVGGQRQVTGGVPLLPGQARETTELRLATKDAAGNLVAVPAQFRVLARWWRADNSIRWVLVDFSINPGWMPSLEPNELTRCGRGSIPWLP